MIRTTTGQRLAKGIFCMALISFFTSPLVAQTYWGMTSDGGEYGLGTIYTVQESGVFTKKYDFFRVEGSTPKGDLILASNGKYYGVTEFGGQNGIGTIFEYNATTGAHTSLYDLANAGGSQPIRGLTQGPNGNLFGLCSAGGTNGLGTVFEFNPNTNIYLVRHHFNNTNGRTPRGRMVLASNGLMYGTTQLGGTNSRGVIFRFNPGNSSFAKLYDMTTANGSNPFSAPIQASNGLLYGTTQTGGANNAGAIYQFNVTTSAYLKIHDMNVTDGQAPLAEMTQASSGILYGATSDGGANSDGVIFSLNPVGNIYTNQFDLTSATGAVPYGKLHEAPNGLLYGNTERGGLGDDGCLYSFNPITSAYTKLIDLQNHGLSSSWGGFINSGTNMITALCAEKGQGSGGSIFTYNYSNSSVTVNVSFNLAEGGQPKGRLFLASNGKFYGLSGSGGNNASGTVFSFDPNTNVHTKLADLSMTLGRFPAGSLVEFGNKLYGFCAAGGTSDQGTIIEFDLNSNTVTKKLDLNASTGHSPEGGFMIANNGRLYATTKLGGTSNGGALLEYIPSTNALTVLRSFTIAEGIYPIGDLIQGSNGKLYGTLSDEGLYFEGALFEYDLNGTFTILHSFDLFQGSNPLGKLLERTPGKIYGINSDGAGFFNGNVFSYELATSFYDQEFDFELQDGTLCHSGFIMGNDSNLYSTNSQGGTGSGTVYRYLPSTRNQVILRSLSANSDGRFPFDGVVGEGAGSQSVAMNLKVFLEGPFDNGAGMMDDDLRTLAQFPTTEPFTALGFTHVGEGGGGSINPAILSTTGNNAIVDWVMVELRDKSNNANVVNTREALVQRDGDVVDLDGVSSLTMGVSDDDYYLSVKHRNHLGILAANVVGLSSASAATVDFTDGSTATFGSEAQKLIGSTLVNWSGNVERDTQIKYSGSNNDRDPILVRIGGSIPTATVIDYSVEDVNLDGVIKYSGSNNDRDPILVNIGGSIPTAVRNEQLP